MILLLIHLVKNGILQNQPLSLKVIKLKKRQERQEKEGGREARRTRERGHASSQGSVRIEGLPPDLRSNLARYCTQGHS